MKRQLQLLKKQRKEPRLLKKPLKEKNNMGDWELEIAFHWPHNRFALGWETIMPDEEYNYCTIKVYLLIVTLTLDF
ncbi:MAG: hypothetical protein GKR90_26280 [Pseudomonadales bacterium]|nr:hypothetical protein [Pseudomonadales bacterium]